jgi:hypothetical protein
MALTRPNPSIKRSNQLRGEKMFQMKMICQRPGKTCSAMPGRTGEIREELENDSRKPR